MLPLIPLLNVQLSFELVYVIVAPAGPSTVMPAPFAAAAESEPFATVIFKSSTSNVAVFSVVVLPCTVRSPPTIT